MKRICPITYEWVDVDLPNPFNRNGLRRLSPHLTQLQPLDYTHQGIRTLAEAQSDSLAFPGSQAKLSMSLSVQQAALAPDQLRGRYLVKPQHADIEKLPENESITLHLARIAGLDTAPFGLIDTLEDSFALWTRRVDRIGQNTTLKRVSFAEILQQTGEAHTTENLIQVINDHTSFPVKERATLFRVFLFNFLTCNSGMHAGKWHLLTDSRGITSIAPLFGLRNSQLAGTSGTPESSLPIANNGSRLDKPTIHRYLGCELLQLPDTFINNTVQGMLRHAIAWKLAIDRSYLSTNQKFDYQQSLTERIGRLR